jgi:SsrA-binding protein
MGKGSNKPKALPSYDNRRARHDYFIEDTLECGIVLQGSEVKAIREGNASLSDGYVSVKASPPGLSVHNMHVGEYQPAGAAAHAPKRVRHLLASKKEILKLARQVDQKGVTLVPLRMYFKGSLIKVEVALARGKQQHDKRQALAERQTKRELDRVMSKFKR